MAVRKQRDEKSSYLKDIVLVTPSGAEIPLPFDVIACFINDEATAKVWEGKTITIKGVVTSPKEKVVFDPSSVKLD